MVKSSPSCLKSLDSLSVQQLLDDDHIDRLKNSEPVESTQPHMGHDSVENFCASNQVGALSPQTLSKRYIVLSAIHGLWQGTFKLLKFGKSAMSDSSLTHEVVPRIDHYRVVRLRYAAPRRHLAWSQVPVL